MSGRRHERGVESASGDNIRGFRIVMIRLCCILCLLTSDHPLGNLHHSLYLLAERLGKCSRSVHLEPGSCLEDEVADVRHGLTVIESALDVDLDVLLDTSLARSADFTTTPLSDCTNVLGSNLDGLDGDREPLILFELKLGGLSHDYLSEECFNCVTRDDEESEN